jgi:hypothetical protein
MTQMDSTTTRKKFAKWVLQTVLIVLKLPLQRDLEVELVGLNNEEATNLI